MKGLFLNHFYSSIGNMKLFSALVLVVAVVVLATGSPTAQELFVYIAITALSANAVVSTRKDASSKWHKYELTLPVRRKQIIQCKYLSYLFWVGVGMAFALVVTLLSMVLHKNANLLYGLENLYSMFALGMGIALLTGTIFYPTCYLVGVDKSETVLMISVLLAIGLAIAALNLLNLFVPVFALRLGLFILFYVALFSVSYVTTVCIYAKKEF